MSHDAIRWVYPRTYGGTRCKQYSGSDYWGLSPHIRGNARFDGSCDLRPGSIPAHTGERSIFPYCLRVYWVYPRTYGGTAGIAGVLAIQAGLSPHIRGNGRPLSSQYSCRGSIPAHTGERSSLHSHWHDNWVYPRTYGGTKRRAIFLSTHMGLSPHIRGNEIRFCIISTTIRSIPAHTGERLALNKLNY